MLAQRATAAQPRRLLPGRWSWMEAGGVRVSMTFKMLTQRASAAAAQPRRLLPLHVRYNGIAVV